MPRAGRSGVRISAGVRDFSLLQKTQNNSVAHPASCSMGAAARSQCKAAEAWRWPITPIYVGVKDDLSSTSTPALPLHIVDEDKFTFTVEVPWNNEITHNES